MSMRATELSPQWVMARVRPSGETASILGRGPVGMTRTMLLLCVSMMATAEGEVALGSQVLR